MRSHCSRYSGAAASSTVERRSDGIAHRIASALDGFCSARSPAIVASDSAERSSVASLRLRWAIAAFRLRYEVPAESSAGATLKRLSTA